MIRVTGFHHATGVTGNPWGNHHFYTHVLGLRLVKKTVYQDALSSYHLYYGDRVGTPGTVLSFFETQKEEQTECKVRVCLRVPSAESLVWWEQRLKQFDLPYSEFVERGSRRHLDFQDMEGHKLSLIVDDLPEAERRLWSGSPVPVEHQIRGLGPVIISVRQLQPTKETLCELLKMKRTGRYKGPGVYDRTHRCDNHIFQFGEQGIRGEIHLAVEPDQSATSAGAGTIHCIALRVPDNESFQDWFNQLRRHRVPSSGQLDRYYFESLYFRDPNGILLELATEDPGFIVDEPMESLGEKLSLPPDLEGHRKEIESSLRPFTSSA